MSILVLMPERYRGGAEKQFNYIVEGLRRRGEECYILYTDSSGDKNDEKMAYRIDNSLPFFWREMRLISTVLKLKKQYDFKTVIVYDKYGHYLIPFLKMMRLRVVFSERNSGKHKNPIGRFFLGKADIITANSKSATEILSAYIRKKINYIPNGIMVENIQRTIKTEYVKPIKICIPARIDRVKNQLFIISTISRIENVELHLAGKVVDEVYYQELYNFIKDNKLSDVVIFDGFVNNMKHYYANFDIVVLPSLSEGTPNIVLEAYANKIICLMSNIPMNIDVAVSEKQIFDLNDENSFIDVFNNVIDSDYVWRSELVNKAYSFVVNNYSVDQMVNRYYDLIKGHEK